MHHSIILEDSSKKQSRLSDRVYTIGGIWIHSSIQREMVKRMKMLRRRRRRRGRRKRKRRQRLRRLKEKARGVSGKSPSSGSKL